MKARASSPTSAKAALAKLRPADRPAEAHGTITASTDNTSTVPQTIKFAAVLELLHAAMC
jgi:hypothetical protein